MNDTVKNAPTDITVMLFKAHITGDTVLCTPKNREYTEKVYAALCQMLGWQPSIKFHTTRRSHEHNTIGNKIHGEAVLTHMHQ